MMCYVLNTKALDLQCLYPPWYSYFWYPSIPASTIFFLLLYSHHYPTFWHHPWHTPPLISHPTPLFLQCVKSFHDFLNIFFYFFYFIIHKFHRIGGTEQDLIMKLFFGYTDPDISLLRTKIQMNKIQEDVYIERKCQ